MEYSITQALTTSVIGIGVVMLILAIIAVLIILISKIIRITESKLIKAPSDNTPAAASTPAPVAGINQEVELINTDERTAAVIMAIVSQQSGIPVNRLSFKSIRLMDENEKGGKA